MPIWPPREKIKIVLEPYEPPSPPPDKTCRICGGQFPGWHKSMICWPCHDIPRETRGRSAIFHPYLWRQSLAVDEATIALAHLNREIDRCKPTRMSSRSSRASTSRRSRSG